MAHRGTSKKSTIVKLNYLYHERENTNGRKIYS